MDSFKSNFLILSLFLLVFNVLPAQEISDLVRDGELENVREYLTKHPDVINVLTETDTGRKLTLLHIAVNAGNLKMVQLLLAFKPNLDIKNDVGETPLFVAVGEANEAICKALLAAGADGTIQRSDGSYPIHRAVRINYEVANTFSPPDEEDVDNEERKQVEKQIISLLMILRKSGANLKQLDSKKRSALHIAAQCGYADVVKYLLDCGVDGTLETEEGCTPLFYALSKKRSKTTETLLQSGIQYDFFSAIEADKLEIVKELVKKDQSLLSKHFGIFKTAVAYAAMKNNLQILQYLLESGCKPSCTDLGVTPLQYAAGSSYEMTELLLKYEKEDVNFADRSGSTPLHQAVSGNKPKIIRLLRDAGADPAIKNRAGYSPTDLAEQSGDKGLIESMLSNN